MRYLWVISSFTLFIIGMTACQPASPLTPTSEKMEPQTMNPGVISENTPTQVLIPILTPEDTDLTSPLPLDATAQKMVVLTKEHLAQSLSIPVEQITVLEVKPVVWRDASLGCPKPAVDYIPMETPGYSIVLEADGLPYNYHTDEVKRFVACNRT